MSKRRTKKREEEHPSESWLLPYADLLTLLLALFIVLFAMSSIDAQKFQKFSKVLNGVFVGGTSFFDYTKQTADDNNGSSEVKSVETKKQTQNNLTNNNQASSNTNNDQQLKDTQEKIDQYIQAKKLKGKFQTSLTDEGLLITIRDNVLFDSGEASVRKGDIKTAKQLSHLLEMDTPRSIIVSGYTDNVPIHNSKYKSNWELSVMRATNFLKILLENSNLNAKYFSVRGYGEFKPIASNATAAGREKNRRVEVLIFPKTNGKSQ